MTYEQHTLSNTICCFSSDAVQKAEYLVTELLATLQYKADNISQLLDKTHWMYSVPVVEADIEQTIIEQADEMAFYVYNALCLGYNNGQA